MFDLRQYQEAFQLWISALLNPSQFLSEAFAPTNEQFTEGLEFYLKVVVATLFIFGLITTFAGNSPLVIRARMLANGLLGIVFLFVGAMAVHFPLWLLGGKSSFYGTLLTYIYASVPYAPLMAIAQWIMVAGMPSPLRRYAFNPATAQEAAQVAVQDPETDKLTYFIGVLLGLGLMGWALYVTFRSLSLVHDVAGWSLAIAIVVSGLILAPISVVNRRMASMIFGEPQPEPEPA